MREDGKYAVAAKHVATPGSAPTAPCARAGRSASRPCTRASAATSSSASRRRCGRWATSPTTAAASAARPPAASSPTAKSTTWPAACGPAPGLVKSVFAGKGGYKVRHPSAGEHVEAPLSKQVLVFAKGDKPFAIYPISSGKSSTPTVTGHFEFIRQEPGYNSHGMYYSFYFYGGYAVHGYESVPDYPASHGCLRTFIADQPEIYERIFFGEDIFIW